MARKKLTDVEKKLMREIANNLRNLLKLKKWNQSELAEKSGLSTSVISDYLNEKTMPTPGSIEVMSKALGVSKRRIDPTFKSNSSDDEKLQFFEDLEQELGIDLSDLQTQKMLKKAAKIFFSRED